MEDIDTATDSQEAFFRQTQIQAHNRQRIEDTGSRKEKIQIWTLSWLNDIKGEELSFFPYGDTYAIISDSELITNAYNPSNPGIPEQPVPQKVAEVAACHLGGLPDMQMTRLTYGIRVCIRMGSWGDVVPGAAWDTLIQKILPTSLASLSIQNSQVPAPSSPWTLN